mmetsp:Transcript_71972/g.114099  ORF Transcript_71972/g.114099 Transcript_71972/m.114099 type:complete len:411 (+) Transcript_71972:110-1342(+)
MSMAHLRWTLSIALLFIPAGRSVILRGNSVRASARNENTSVVANISASVETMRLDVVVSDSARKFTYNASAFAGRKIMANRPPRIFFLFLAVDKVSNLNVWTKFFETAPLDQYRALVHCKLPQCLAQIAGSFLIPVPTVNSYYCTDLVSPMNQLLGHALNNDPGWENPQDKFVFVSDSSLPAKPFSFVYNTLAWRQGSDFCAFPANEWADIPGQHGGLEMAVKVHQWIVLERLHAVNACIMWASGKDHNFMHKFQMNWNPYQWNNNTYADNRNFGCLDEFWHMAALFGTLSHVDSARDAVVSLQMFTNTPLRVSAAAGWQGACDTFVMWSKYLHAPGNNPFSQLHTSLDPASIPHGGNDQRPGWWDTISSYGIRAIRNSGFLFVRKFIDMPRHADGGDFATEFSNIVFLA